jgi:hypothetical protein
MISPPPASLPSRFEDRSMLHRILLPAWLSVAVAAGMALADDAQPAPLPPDDGWVTIESPACAAPTARAGGQPRAYAPSDCVSPVCPPRVCAPRSCPPRVCLPELDWGCACQEGYATADALFLTLDEPDRRVLVLDEQLAPVLETSDLDYGTQAGLRLTVGRRLNECLAIETTYFGLHYWEDDAVLARDDALRLPGPLGRLSADFSDADVMAVETAARLENVEINLFRSGSCSNWSFLMGFRYIGFEEDFDITSLDLDSGVSQYDVDAANNMFGMQIGGLWQKQLTCRWSVDFVSKGGIFGNAAEQRTVLGDFNNRVLVRDTDTDQGHVAFASEIGVNTTYRLSSCLSLRGGYNWLWLSGVARAADQLDFTRGDGAGLDTSTAALHGPSAGLEACW